MAAPGVRRLAAGVVLGARSSAVGLASQRGATGSGVIIGGGRLLLHRYCFAGGLSAHQRRKAAVHAAVGHAPFAAGGKARQRRRRGERRAAPRGRRAGRRLIAPLVDESQRRAPRRQLLLVVVV